VGALVNYGLDALPPLTCSDPRKWYAPAAAAGAMPAALVNFLTARGALFGHSGASS